MYIIQECEDPNESKDTDYKKWAKNHLWIGDTKNKGLGIFAKKNIQLDRIDWKSTFEEQTVKHFLPCSVNNEFELVAVWTHQNNSQRFAYIGQFWKYLQFNKANFKNVVLTGDFNSNAIWDRKSRHWNHSDVVRELREIEIESLYHKYTREDHGKETCPTFYLHRNLAKPYHMDYCFASSSFSKRLKSVTVGGFEDWKHLSDHSPVLCSFSRKP